MARRIVVLALLIGLVYLSAFGVEGGHRHKREDWSDGLIKVFKSHYYVRPPRVYIPTTGYMAPPPYQPIPYYETKPYTSGDSYQQYRYIPNDAY